MKHMQTTICRMRWLVAVVAVATVGVGCPLFGGNWLPLGTGKVTVAFTADSSPLKTIVEQVTQKAGNSDIPLDQIQSLTVTVDEIQLISDDASATTVDLLPTPTDVDLMNLIGLSDILSTQDIPAAHYVKMMISISDPRLVLTSDPTVLTNVQLTANGRLFINTDFEVQDGQSGIIVIDFGGIHLVLNGSGDYVLTPQLTATLSFQELQDVIVVGNILTQNATDEMFTMDGGDPGNEDVDVAYGSANVFLPSDINTPSGDSSNLAVGETVDVEGALQVDGSVVATDIHIISGP